MPFTTIPGVEGGEASRHGSEKQEHCEDDQVYYALKHCGQAGTKVITLTISVRNQQDLVPIDSKITRLLIHFSQSPTTCHVSSGLKRSMYLTICSVVGPRSAS